MERYIGLDVHAQSCTMAVVSGTGKRVGLQVVETNGAALREAIGATPGNLHICLEEGTQSGWLYEILKNQGEVVVAIPEGHRGQKDDARDAWGLAESLRVGSIKRRVYKGCGPFSELRAAVRNYEMLRDDVRRISARTHDALDDAIRRAMDLIDGSDPSAWFGHCGYSGQLK
jgi:hypothetical protein